MDMTFGIAQEMNINVTYGWLITQVTSGGPAHKAGLQAGTTTVQIAGNLVTIGGDIVVAINGARITNIDGLSTYLAEYTLPGQTATVTFVRTNETLTSSLILEARPSPT
jgi:S1-C subfamily serine protease